MFDSEYKEESDLENKFGIRCETHSLKKGNFLFRADQNIDEFNLILDNYFQKIKENSDSELTQQANEIIHILSNKENMKIDFSISEEILAKILEISLNSADLKLVTNIFQIILILIEEDSKYLDLLVENNYIENLVLLAFHNPDFYLSIDSFLDILILSNQQIGLFSDDSFFQLLKQFFIQHSKKCNISVNIIELLIISVDFIEDEETLNDILDNLLNLISNPKAKIPLLKASLRLISKISDLNIFISSTFHPICELLSKTGNIKFKTFLMDILAHLAENKFYCSQIPIYDLISSLKETPNKQYRRSILNLFSKLAESDEFNDIFLKSDALESLTINLRWFSAFDMKESIIALATKVFLHCTNETFQNIPKMMIIEMCNFLTGICEEEAMTGILNAISQLCAAVPEDVVEELRDTLIENIDKSFLTEAIEDGNTEAIEAAKAIYSFCYE